MAKAKKQEAQQEGQQEPAKKPAALKAAKSAGPAPAEPKADTAAAATPGPKPKRAAKVKAAAAASEDQPSAAATAGPTPAVAAPAAKPAAAAKVRVAAAKPSSASAGASRPASPTPAPAPRPAAFTGIDTGLAAKAAASFVANRDLIGGLSFGSSPAQAAAPSQPSGGTAPASPRPEQKSESGSFKNLKQTLAQPGGGLNKILGIPGGVAGAKKAGLPFGSTGNNTRNQAGSASGNKFGVPRRSNG